MPLMPKCSQLLFRSTTRECFSAFVSAETIVMSMLFDRDLQVPDASSSIQLQNLFRSKSANPFTKSDQRAKQTKALEKLEPSWAPEIPVFSSVRETSAAGRAMKKPAVPLLDASPPPLSRNSDPSSVDCLAVILDGPGEGATSASCVPSAQKRPRRSSQHVSSSDAHISSVDAVSSREDGSVASVSSVSKRGRGRPRSQPQVIARQYCFSIMSMVYFPLTA